MPVQKTELTKKGKETRPGGVGGGDKRAFSGSVLTERLTHLHFLLHFTPGMRLSPKRWQCGVPTYLAVCICVVTCPTDRQGGGGEAQPSPPFLCFGTQSRKQQARQGSGGGVGTGPVPEPIGRSLII